jgi:C-terminal duplication domain of Friend of PRMT1
VSEPYPAGVREWDIGKEVHGRWEHDAYEEDEFGRERPATRGGRRSRGRREGINRERGERRGPAVKEDLDAELDAYASRAS